MRFTEHPSYGAEYGRYPGIVPADGTGGTHQVVLHVCVRNFGNALHDTRDRRADFPAYDAGSIHEETLRLHVPYLFVESPGDYASDISALHGGDVDPRAVEAFQGIPTGIQDQPVALGGPALDNDDITVLHKRQRVQSSPHVFR